ncbi:hypothetical protein LTR17_022270 [Elasticomyces elasticus]|nr:hypothetical protein LTR17_022270 [Elasticomyces elasticus]
MEPPQTYSTTAQPETPFQSLYSTLFLDAVKLYNAHKFDDCIEAARDILKDPTLPRYYRIKTLLAITNAEENWYPAERCRREAEDVHLMGQRLTTPENEAALDWPHFVLSASQQREAPSEVDERFLVPGFDPNDVEWNDEEVEEQRKEEKAVGAEGAAASRKWFEEKKAGPEQRGEEGVNSQQYSEDQQVIQGGLERNRSHELPAIHGEEPAAAKAPIVVPQLALPLPEDADAAAEPGAHVTPGLAAHTTNSP